MEKEYIKASEYAKKMSLNGGFNTRFRICYNFILCKNLWSKKK